MMMGLYFLTSALNLFGTTIGDLDESHLYFIELDMNFLVSTDDLEVDNSLMKVYPNPVEGQDLLFIDSYSTIAGEYNLYDPQGRLAITGTKPRGIAHHSFSTQGIASGVYILKYREEKKIQNQIIIIK